MKRFYLIRHGEKEKFAGDPGLTAIGMQQAQRTAEYLQSFPIQCVVASPLLRTQQTAQTISKQFGLKYLTHDLLKERANWGDDPNQSRSNFLNDWHKATWQRDYPLPFADSSLTAGKRIEKLIQSLNTTEYKHIAFVTHGGIIMDFLRNVIPENELTSVVKVFSHGKDFDVTECSVTIIDVEDERYTLLQLASAHHLVPNAL